MKDKTFEKINIKIVISNVIVMYSCTKFQSFSRTSDFGTKFAEKNMNDKNFEKINIKTEIRM